MPPKPCLVENCTKPSRRLGYCPKHYERFNRHGDPLHETYRSGCDIEGCTRPHKAKGLCSAHYARKRYAGTTEPFQPAYEPRIDPRDGYVRIFAPELACAGKDGRALEHRAVMERHLGRPLLPSESVHHRNGLRDDNRLKNLELWVRSQPTGVRVHDLLEWARLIIDRYEDALSEIHFPLETSPVNLETK